MGVPRCGNLWDHVMDKINNNNREEGICTNSHCFDGVCKGECERDYHFQALRVVRRELEEIKAASRLLRRQKGVL